MTMEEIEKAIARVHAMSLATDVVVQCMLTAHPNPSGLLASIERRIAEMRAVTGLEMLRIGTRDEQCVSDALDAAWDRWLAIARQSLAS